MTRLVFDMSSYIKTGMLTGSDRQHGTDMEWEGRRITIPSAEYGWENVTNMMVKALNDTGLCPRHCILVFEGMHSKNKRLLIDKTYKSKRDKRPPQFYEEFNRLKDFVRQTWLDMGAICVTQDYVEADDVIAWLAQEAEEDMIIASRDNDLGALNTEEGATNSHGAQIRTYNDGLIGIVKLKGELFVHPYRYINLFKALAGDDSDTISGVPRFGPKMFQTLAEQYGYDGLDELIVMLERSDLSPLEELIDADPKLHKLVKMIYEARTDALRCWQVAKLHPEWVNTLQYPVQWTAGKVVPEHPDCDDRLAKYYGKSKLVTSLNYREAYVFIRDEMDRTEEPAFDIETSTGEESDEWLELLKDPEGVDTLGSTLTGFSITFGPNMQYTVYVAVDHADTENVSMSEARALVQLMGRCRATVIQNTFFELPVLYGQQDEDSSWWRDHWRSNGYHGFLPKCLDTKLEASYVDENREMGLKSRSALHLGYQQETYDQVTLLTGLPGEMPEGGKLVEELEDGLQRRRYKMNELSAVHVFSYGCDDTICTAALHNYYKLRMQLEHTWKVYLDVEISAAYQHAKNFCDGMPFSLERMRQLEREDDVTYEKAWQTVRAYLLAHQWEGTVPPTYGTDISPKQVKQAYAIVKGLLDAEDEDDEGEDSAGDESEDENGPAASSVEGPSPEAVRDPFLATRVRLPSKLLACLRDLGHDLFAGMLENCYASEEGAARFTAWVRSQFKGEPLMRFSNKQMCYLLYEAMKLPLRVTNKPTKKMRAKGLKVGNPKGDALALEYALLDATPEQKAVLESIRLMLMVRTRRNLYYSKYPYFIHWLTGRIHPSHNQCATNTRRASSSKPNMQQMPKHPKIEGVKIKFRECVIPHKKSAVVVSLDFNAQELRVIADYSHDPNMVACYVGENKKDMHSLTGHSIMLKKKKGDFSYEVFVEYIERGEHDPDFKKTDLYKMVKKFRVDGKKVNFTTEYGAMAPKLAATMLVSEEEAQMFIDAREQQFKVAAQWKQTVIAEAKRFGFVRTKEGAVRHLQEALKSDDPWIRSKAERQAVNFKVQGSCGEMTKKAEGRVWDSGLTYNFDAICIGPIHDEIVFSVAIKDLPQFLKAAHWCMTQPYGGMFIPIESSISFGPNFGEQHEIGMQPDPAAIAEALTQFANVS